MNDIGLTWQKLYFDAQRKELIERIELAARGVLREQQERRESISQLEIAHEAQKKELKEMWEARIKRAAEQANRAALEYEKWQKENKGE
jgi:hypothetical protein